MSLRNEPGSIRSAPTEQTESESVDATVGILASVLRVFAARGRAIREARERSGFTCSDTAQSKIDQMSTENAFGISDEPKPEPPRSAQEVVDE
jgi:hypothetical protein